MQKDRIGGSEKSLAIPLPESHIHRTESELQLYEDMAVAEYRDRCMFNRLVSGIRQRQQLHYNVELHAYAHAQVHNIPYQHPQQQQQHQPHQQQGPQPAHDLYQQHHQSTLPPSMQDTERSIENIISTRCQPVAVAPSSTSTPANQMTPIGIDMTVPTITQVTNGHRRHTHTVVAPSDDADDWAIEGYDSPQSTSASASASASVSTIPLPHIIHDVLDAAANTNDHSDHVFDIEL